MPTRYSVRETVNGEFLVDGPEIYSGVSQESLTYTDRVAAQCVVNTLNTIYASGYSRAQYDMRKALGVKS